MHEKKKDGVGMRKSRAKRIVEILIAFFHATLLILVTSVIFGSIIALLAFIVYRILEWLFIV